MDRRYVCGDCGVKWFIPASQPHREDLTDCDACGGQLVRFDPSAHQPPMASPPDARAE